MMRLTHFVIRGSFTLRGPFLVRLVFASRVSHFDGMCTIAEVYHELHEPSAAAH